MARFVSRSRQLREQDVYMANDMFADLHNAPEMPGLGEPSLRTRREQIRTFLGKTGLGNALPEDAFIASNLAFHPSLVGLRKDEIEVITERNLMQQEMHDLMSTPSESDHAS